MSHVPVGPDRGPTPSTPRWVKVGGTIVIALILLFVILQLTGVAGDHGPGRHAIPGGAITSPSVAWITLGP